MLKSVSKEGDYSLNYQIETISKRFSFKKCKKFKKKVLTMEYSFMYIYQIFTYKCKYNILT